MKVKIKPRLLLGILVMGGICYGAMYLNFKEVALAMAVGIVAVIGGLVEIEKDE